jgi:hypothetical protein
MVCDDHCKGCYYLAGQVGRSHQETYCLYWERADKLRGCPAGTGCTKKITKKEYIAMAKIDKEQARQMWLEGKTDDEIAKAFGVTKQAVSAIRRKHWEKADDFAGPVSEVAEDRPAVCPEELHEDCVVGGDRCAVDEDMVDPEEEDAKVLIRALELMTSHLKGMEAVMTAQVVTALWKWQDKEDLIEVRNCLDYLIGRCEK